MGNEQFKVSEEQHFLPGLDCPIEDLLLWEDIFRKGLPLPTDKGDLVKFKSTLEKFSSLMRRAMAGRSKLINVQMIQGNNDLFDFVIPEEELSAMTSMRSLIPLIPEEDVAPSLLRLETGLESYLNGQIAEPDDRNLIFFIVDRIKVKMMFGDSLIVTIPSTPRELNKGV